MHVLVLWIKKWRRKIETFLISPLHCTKCKMRNEKEKLFSPLLSSQERLECLPVTLNLYFSRFFPDYKALFIAYRVACWFLPRMRKWSWLSRLMSWARMTCPITLFGMCAVLLISPLFIVPFRSSTRANHFMEISLLLFISISIFFCTQISPFKRQKIIHPSGLRFNGTFQLFNFPLVVVVVVRL